MIFLFIHHLATLLRRTWMSLLNNNISFRLKIQAVVPQVHFQSPSIFLRPNTHESIKHCMLLFDHMCFLCLKSLFFNPFLYGVTCITRSTFILRLCMYIQFCLMNCRTFCFFLFVQVKTSLLKTVWLMLLIGMKRSPPHTVGLLPLPSPYSPAYSTFL